MTIKIELTPDEEALLKRRAESAGVTSEEFAHRTLVESLGIPGTGRLQFELTPEEWMAEFRAWSEGHDRTTPLLTEESLSRENLHPDRF